MLKREPGQGWAGFTSRFGPALPWRHGHGGFHIKYSIQHSCIMTFNKLHGGC